MGDRLLPLYTTAAQAYGVVIPHDISAYRQISDASLFPASANPVEAPTTGAPLGVWFDYARTADGLDLQSQLGRKSGFWQEVVNTAPVLHGLFAVTANLVGFLSHRDVPAALREHLHAIVSAQVRTLDLAVAQWQVLQTRGSQDPDIPGAAAGLLNQIRLQGVQSRGYSAPVANEYFGSFREQLQRAQVKHATAQQKGDSRKTKGRKGSQQNQGQHDNTTRTNQNDGRSA